MPESKDKFPLQHNPGRQHEETEQRVNTRGPNFNVLENSSSQPVASTIVSDTQRVSSEARNAIPQQNRHSQGPKSSSRGNEVGKTMLQAMLSVCLFFLLPYPLLCFLQGFKFLSLSTSVCGLNQKLNAPYLDSIARQQHMSMPLSTSKIYNSHSHPDQLSGVAASRQVWVHKSTPYLLFSPVMQLMICLPDTYILSCDLILGPTAATFISQEFRPILSSTRLDGYLQGAAASTDVLDWPYNVDPV